MAILLPTTPPPRTFTPHYVEFGTSLRSPLGGPTQNVLRLGDRMSVDFEMPIMRETTARAWVAALMDAKASGEMVRMGIPQADASPLAMLFDGVANSLTGQVSGDGHFGLFPGMFLSVVGGNGTSYLHMVTRKTGVSVRLSPRLRTNLSGAAQMKPAIIEGWLDTKAEWTVDVARTVGLTFTVAEGR